MPKLLSRSKHEEFESNSALQIRNQEERIAENGRKWNLQNLVLGALFTALALFIQQPLFTCFLTPQILLQFFVSSDIIPCNSFWFWLRL